MGFVLDYHLCADYQEEHLMVTIRLILFVNFVVALGGAICSGIVMIAQTGHLVLRELPNYWQLGLSASIIVMGGFWMFRKQFVDARA